MTMTAGAAADRGSCPFCRAAARLVARLDRNQRLALLSRDDDAATPYVARIPAHEIQESWQLVEPSGVRMMHGPAAIRVVEYIPAKRWLAWIMRTFRLTPLVTAVFNRVFGRIRKPLGRFFPNPQLPRRWP
jgi:predicted DCC family thiol-disulfide oxidoreductase YuxK